MSRQFEYHFVRLEQTSSWFTGTGTPSASARNSYQQVVHEHARLGWRLVQIFAPCLATHGIVAYFELIFEREVSS